MPDVSRTYLTYCADALQKAVCTNTDRQGHALWPQTSFNFQDSHDLAEHCSRTMRDRRRRPAALTIARFLLSCVQRKCRTWPPCLPAVQGYQTSRQVSRWSMLQLPSIHRARCKFHTNFHKTKLLSPILHDSCRSSQRYLIKAYPRDHL